MIRKAALSAFILAASAVSNVSAEAPRTRDFELTYTAKITDIPEGARKVDVWLPYPASDEQQEVTVTEVTSPVPHQILADPRYKNSVLHLSIDDPKTRELTVGMKVRVRRRELVRKGYDIKPARGKRSLPPEAARWLEPERLVPLDEQIRKIARDVTRGKKTDFEKVRAIYDYVVDTMSYDKSGTGWGNGDIYWACDAKRGNCTDFHALFTGLVRAVGIPARFEIGFPIPSERGQGEIGGYHCWAQFYLAGYGWVPVDASEARKHPEKRDYFFGALDENRVQFTTGRDIVLNPRQAGDPLNYFIYPYVEVDGKRFEKIAKTFRYQDHSGQVATGKQ